jgi:predicted nucleic acid-binding protein
MKKIKLYLETSFISAAIDDRNPEKKKYTLRLIDEIMHDGYEAFISRITIVEINKSDPVTLHKLIEVVRKISPQELTIDVEVQSLAEKYIKAGVVPAKYDADAVHIAVASVYDLDVIVSWNFEHIVKFKTKRDVMGINVLNGYREIDIYSPLEVVKDV